MVFPRFGRAMHRTRCAVSRRHRAVGGSRRFVTAVVRMRRRRLMSGAAITRHQRRHPSSLDDQPGGRPQAKVSTDCRHTSVQLSGAGSRPQTERRSRLVQGPESHVPCQVQVAGINRFCPQTVPLTRYRRDAPRKRFRSGATLLLVLVGPSASARRNPRALRRDLAVAGRLRRCFRVPARLAGLTPKRCSRARLRLASLAAARSSRRRSSFFRALGAPPPSALARRLRASLEPQALFLLPSSFFLSSYFSTLCISPSSGSVPVTHPLIISNNTTG